MTPYEMAQQYYPRLWDKSRLDALVEAGRLTIAERERIINMQKEEENEYGN